VRAKYSAHKTDAVAAMGPGRGTICTGQYAVTLAGKDFIFDCIYQIRNLKAIFELSVPLPTPKNQLAAWLALPENNIFVPDWTSGFASQPLL